ncbi:MAG: sigma-70 family RNA polymerase sigma factor [Anaerolineae bacterium]|nr:sigma-70 family RNA polymerase sigma factor [Anaerolineae bacterium]
MTCNESMQNADPDPEALIARSLQGDEEAFAALYEACAPGVYRLAYGVLLHVQDAEEVVQDVFVYVYRNRDKFDPARGAFQTWLYTITISRCRNKRRRKWLPTVMLSQLVNQGLEPAGAHHETPAPQGHRRQKAGRATARAGSSPRAAVGNTRISASRLPAPGHAARRGQRDDVRGDGVAQEILCQRLCVRVSDQ